MDIKEIIELVGIGAAIVIAAVAIIRSVAKGKLKEFVIEKMEEAEKLEKNGKEKLEYVLTKVKDEYKLPSLLLNVKDFIEKVIDITKKIN